jgi:hypothetical protein
MSTTETANGHAPGLPKFCRHCGTSLRDGRFCPGCGASVEGADDLADTLVAEPWPPRAAASEPIGAGGGAGADPRMPEPGPDGNRRRTLAAVAGGVLVLAIAAIVALVVVGRSSGESGSDSAAADYGQRLGTAFAPVRSSNRELSDQLLRLRGTRAIDARAALRKARQATSLAQGATNALTAPAGERQIGERASQMLDRETAYLSAVGAVLSDPSSPTASEIQGLASNLTSAISAAPPVAGSVQDVSGADRLTAWALQTRRVIRRRAARRRAASARRRTGSTVPVAPSSTASFTACDQNISAKNGTTSCAFAENVFWEYWYFTTSGQGTRFTAYSPSTHMVYEVNCGGTSPVVCTTDTGAEIHFPVSAIDAYTQSQADAYAASKDLGPDPTALEGGA